VTSFVFKDTDGDYLLRWRNFEASFTKGLSSFLDDEAMVDVTIAAEGQTFSAHKVILSVSSSYFQSIFQVSFNNDNNFVFE